MIQIKNAAELEKMRKAAAISAAALKAGGEAIEPGITTAEIDKIIYDFIVPAISFRLTPAARLMVLTVITPVPLPAASSTWKPSACWM